MGATWIQFFRKRGDQLLQLKLWSVHKSAAGAVEDVTGYLANLETLDISQAARINHGQLVHLLQQLPALRTVHVTSEQTLADAPYLTETFDRLHVLVH